ncbi:methyltransferase domain-containing protein [Candidatus Sumerlaeota bacterium]|nr:methyltransferase domain-containing protein [Candidatus Sumerlaeota bacterium]
MDFEKIKEDEILKKINQYISESGNYGSPANPDNLLNGFNDDFFRTLSILQQVKDPTQIPRDTRFRFLKRVIQRLFRTFTRGQVEFNRIATDVLNRLAGDIRQFFHFYQLNLLEHNKRIEDLHSILENQRQSLKEILEDLIRKTNQGFERLIQQTDATSNYLQKEMDQKSNQIQEGLSLLHKRIDDERGSIFSVMESIKESLHDRIGHVQQNLHQRIDDEKKSIYDSVPGFGFVENKIQETKDHNEKLVKLIDGELRKVEARFNPAEIYGLYQEQNNITDEIYFKLEQNFRGTDEYIAERQDFYRNLLSAHHEEMKDAEGYYLDVGCGRGELLKMLQSDNIPSRGIDINDQMVEKCREIGLSVSRDDAISYLKSLPDGELRGVVALQVIEHLSIKTLFEFLYLIHEKLQPGGIVVLETINPESVYALRWFYMDYTHNRPLPAPLVQFFLYMAGFTQLETILRSPVEGWKQMAVTGKDIMLDDNFNKLNNFLFGYQDYAIRAIK